MSGVNGATNAPKPEPTMADAMKTISTNTASSAGMKMVQAAIQKATSNEENK